MKHNRINLVTTGLLCSFLAVSLQATQKQGQEFFDRLAIAQAPESEHAGLSDAMFDNASQINQHLTTAQAFNAVANSADDLYTANRNQYDNKANAALREFYHTSNNAAEKMNSSLQTIHRHHNEQTRALQKLNDDSRRLTQDVHDSFIKAHQALTNSEMNIRASKRKKEEVFDSAPPKKTKKKSTKKTSTKKAGKNKSRNYIAKEDFENEIA